jgi:hypothetical protein
MRVEDSPEYLELKKIMCEECFNSLIAWITGKSFKPYSPCNACFLTTGKWMMDRNKND